MKSIGLKKAFPTILAFLGAVGVIATAVEAVRVTPKAVELIKQDSRKNHDGDPYAYTKTEAVKSCWKCYIPAAAIGLSTIACTVGSNIISTRTQASLIGAYGMLKQTYQKYKTASKSVFGDDAESKIKAQMAKETNLTADGMSVLPSDLDDGSDKMLFYDRFSKRYFTSTMAAVINAQYHLNRNYVLRGDVCMNEFYEFLGIDKIDDGDNFGWTMDDLDYYGVVFIDFDNELVNLEDGMECVYISSAFEPTDFRTLK